MDTRIAPHTDPDVPAANRIGHTLPGGWRVVERLAEGAEDTNFSSGRSTWRHASPQSA